LSECIDLKHRATIYDIAFANAYEGLLLSSQLLIKQGFQFSQAIQDGNLLPVLKIYQCIVAIGFKVNDMP
jgi:hypothetical protein